MEMAVLTFGRYTIDRPQRCLIKGSEIIPLGGRGFEVLVVLAEAKGAVVTKDALIERVWDGRFINDNALEAQIHGLRRALGADRNLIRTVAGKGYCLVDADADAARGRPPTNLKPDLSSPVPRAELQAEIRLALGQHRLVTLVGPGGIGKSRLSRMAGHDVLDLFPDGVWMVELAAIDSERFVCTAIAGAMEITSVDPGDLRSLVRALAGKVCLLVIDNCEHLLDTVAAAVLELLPGCPGLRILATSREALQIDGERVVTVPALGLPLSSGLLQDSLASPAVKLFVQRFAAGSGSLMVQRDLMALAEICRRVDGIPLAIEMAAAAARTLGVEQVLQELASSLSILGTSRRTAEPRQKTMEATIDWSYRLLTPQEQAVFRALSLLSGGFSAEAAAAVTDMPRGRLVPILSSLVSKSLLGMAATEEGTEFSQLEPMRQYARARLEEAGDYPAAAARHAGLMLAVFEQAAGELDHVPTGRWIGRYRPHLSGLRQALEWAFGPGEDAVTGIRLVAAAEPLWLHLSLVGELLTFIERACARVGGHPDLAPLSVRLDVARGSALLYVTGSTQTTRDALARGLTEARRAGDAAAQVRSLWALTVASVNSGRNGEALTHVTELARVAKTTGNRTDSLIAARALGAVHHVTGDQRQAQAALEDFFRGYHEPDCNSPTSRYHFDQLVAGMAFQARVLWLRNDTVQAQDLARRALERAVEIDHTHSICHALAQASIPLALDQGHHEAAALYIQELVDVSNARGLSVWIAWSQACRACLDIRTGALKPGIARLQAILADAGEVPLSMYHCGLMGELALAQRLQGDHGAGLETIDAAIARAHRTRESWCLPELLRLKAAALTETGADGAAAALAEGWTLAGKQGAELWQARIGAAGTGAASAPPIAQRLSP